MYINIKQLTDKMTTVRFYENINERNFRSVNVRLLFRYTYSAECIDRSLSLSPADGYPVFYVIGFED
jgi:hypothetical protein